MNLTLPTGDLAIVCLGAHPDDIEIGCGATLLRLGAERTVTADFVIVTGSPERRDEALAAAAAFMPGAEVSFGGEPSTFRDGYLPEVWGAVKRRLHDIADEQPAPDIVFAPRRDDAHQDHRLLGELAATVWRSSLVLHYEIPKWDGDMCRPTAYVPIDDETAARKVALLNASYPSQHSRDWWDDELFTSLLRLRGMECHSRYAEAFIIDKAVLTV